MIWLIRVGAGQRPSDAELRADETVFAPEDVTGRRGGLAVRSSPDDRVGLRNGPASRSPCSGVGGTSSAWRDGHALSRIGPTGGVRAVPVAPVWPVRAQRTMEFW